MEDMITYHVKESKKDKQRQSWTVKVKAWVRVNLTTIQSKLEEADVIVYCSLNFCCWTSVVERESVFNPESVSDSEENCFLFCRNEKGENVLFCLHKTKDYVNM